MTVKSEIIKKNKHNTKQALLKVLLWTGIVAVVIFLTLFLSSRIGLFGSIGEMLEFIRSQF